MSLIACVCTRYTNEVLLDRAKRIGILLSSDSFIKHVQRNYISSKIALVTGTELEQVVLDNSGLEDELYEVLPTHKNSIKSLVRTIHIAPNRLSRRNFDNMCHIVETIKKCYLVVAASHKGAGRGGFAIRVAQFAKIPYIDLAEDKIEAKLSKLELIVGKRNSYLAAKKRKEKMYSDIKARKKRTAIAHTIKSIIAVEQDEYEAPIEPLWDVADNHYAVAPAQPLNFADLGALDYYGGGGNNE